MSQSLKETTYDEVNSACNSVDWPQITWHVNSICAKSGRNTIDSEANQIFDADILRQKLVSECEEFYYELFPNEKSKSEGSNNESVLEQEEQFQEKKRKMNIALTKFLKEKGFFHSFAGKTLFIDYDSFLLSMGGFRIPTRHLNDSEVVALLNEFSTGYIKYKKRYELLLAILGILCLFLFSEIFHSCGILPN